MVSKPEATNLLLHLDKKIKEDLETIRMLLGPEVKSGEEIALSISILKRILEGIIAGGETALYYRNIRTTKIVRHPFFDRIKAICEEVET